MTSKSHYNIEMNNTIYRFNGMKFNPRTHYIKSFLNTQKLDKCPECGGKITYENEDEYEAYCTRCGLVTTASIEYVAGIKIDLPYGRR